MAKTQNAADDFLKDAAELTRVLNESPQDFLATATRMGIARRKAYYLVEIHKAFESVTVDRDRLLGIKWTKAQVLARHVSPENVDELLDKAERLPVHQLKETLSGPEPESPKHCVLLYFTPDEYNLFSQVVKAHEEQGSTRSFRYKEQALIKALKKLEA